MIAPASAPPNTSAHGSLDRWLESRPAETRQTLAREISGRARQSGLVVARPDGDVDIPVTLTAEVVDSTVLAQRARDAADILQGILGTVRVILSQGIDSPKARQLFGHFGPFDARCLSRWRSAEDVTIARVDWFLDAAGQHRALELNATIPAMEAYSDAAARAWIETMGGAAGLSSEEVQSLVEKNGSNAEELRRTIVAHAGYHASDRPSIAVIHREGDPQQRELEALVRHFTAMGHPVVLATPDRVTLDGTGKAIVHGIEEGTPAILYRHIFGRRIPAGSALEKIASGDSSSRLQNPINGQYEVKGVLAELSRLLIEEPHAPLGLTERQRERLKAVVPWTRLLEPGTSTTPEGDRVADLVSFVTAHPERFVIKRSWDYGGKSVHLGPEVVDSEGATGWSKRVQDALAEGTGAFVVQSLIASPRKRHLLASADGRTGWEDVYVDASTYTASGDEAVPGGGVARFARSGIVNIVGGGGVAPLIRTEVYQAIVTRLPAPTST